MNARVNVYRGLLLLLWSIILTSLTVILGAVPLRVFRTMFGKTTYWLGAGLIISILLLLDWYALCAGFTSLSILIGTFAEFEETKSDFVRSTVFSVVVTSLIATGVFSLWCFFQGPTWFLILSQAFESSIAQLTSLTGMTKETVPVREIIFQIPGIYIVALLMSLVVSQLLEKRVANLFKIKIKQKNQLSSFRLHASVVWILLASVLGGFVDIGSEYLKFASLNVLNICFVLFFFQGLAVIVRVFFHRMKISPVWQFVVGAILVLHLSFVVMAIGFIDYWIDFRLKWANKPTAINKKV